MKICGLDFWSSFVALCIGLDDANIPTFFFSFWFWLWVYSIWCKTEFSSPFQSVMFCWKPHKIFCENFLWNCNNVFSKRTHSSEILRWLPVCCFNTCLYTSVASRCILVPFERYLRIKNAPKKVLGTLFPYIFHVKPTWNIVYKYLKTKIFSRDSNILLQMHWTSNIFQHSATIIGSFWVLLNYPILNFKKTVCPKNVWMQHCIQTISWNILPLQIYLIFLIIFEFEVKKSR